MPRVRSTVELAAPYHAVRPLYERGDGLAAISPGWLGLEFTEIEGPMAPVEAGTRFRVTARPFGWWPVTSGVVEVVEARFGPDETVVKDRVVDGPVGSWRHRRTLRPAQAGTVVTDDIRYQDPPFGPVGRLATPVLLRLAMADRALRLHARFGRRSEG